MDWKYIKPIKSLGYISDFEKKYDFKFPDEYKECIIKYNGGRPAKRIFDTEITNKREFKSLLSFNYDDRETMWAVNQRDDTEFQTKYIAFATDSSGNLICFNKSNYSVVFVNHETNITENISSTFSDFINSLYSI